MDTHNKEGVSGYNNLKMATRPFFFSLPFRLPNNGSPYLLSFPSQMLTLFSFYLSTVTSPYQNKTTICLCLFLSSNENGQPDFYLKLVTFSSFFPWLFIGILGEKPHMTASLWENGSRSKSYGAEGVIVGLERKAGLVRYVRQCRLQVQLGDELREAAGYIGSERVARDGLELEGSSVGRCA